MPLLLTCFQMTVGEANTPCVCLNVVRKISIQIVNNINYLIKIVEINR